MSVIVALKTKEGLFVGADRCLCKGDFVGKTGESKLFNKPLHTTKGVEYITIGGAGLLDICSVLKHSFGFPEYDTKDSFETYLGDEFLPAFKKYLNERGLLKTEEGRTYSDTEFIFIYNDQIYMINASLGFTLAPDEQYYVIGAGEEYAYGSLATTTNRMNPKKRVKLAIKAAAKFCNAVDNNIDIFEVKKFIKDV